MTRIKIQCRKCRRKLLDENTSETDFSVCCSTWEEVVGIPARSTSPDPDECETPNEYSPWLNECLDKGQWCRGKLTCPGCKSKVGAFDFVHGSRCKCRAKLIPELYFVAAKVDLTLEKPIVPADLGDDKNPRSSCEPLNDAESIRETLPEFNRTSQDCGESIDTPETLEILEGAPFESLSLGDGPTVGTEPGNLSNHSIGSTNPLLMTSSGFQALVDPEDLEGILPNRQMIASTSSRISGPSSSRVAELRRRTHRKSLSWNGNVSVKLSNLIGHLLIKTEVRNTSSIRRNLPEKMRHRRALSHSPVKSVQIDAASKKDSAIPQRMDSKTEEEEEDVIPEKLECAVCLQMFCLPRICHPCRHTFCDPCLRLLATAQDGFNTCPLCRMPIYSTVLAEELEEELEAEYPEEYAKRLEWYEKESGAMGLPLPGAFSPSFFIEVWKRMGPVMNAICIFILCLVCFFVLFLPLIYITTWVVDNVIGIEPSLVWSSLPDLATLPSKSFLTAMASTVFCAVFVYVSFII